MGKYRHASIFRAKMSEQQDPGWTFFALVEKLIHEICIVSGIA